MIDQNRDGIIDTDDLGAIYQQIGMQTSCLNEYSIPKTGSKTSL